MVDKQGGVYLCLYGHGEFYGTECPGCADGLPHRFLPMRTFEYDLSHYAGDYADVGATVLIPEALLERGDEEGVFELFTHLHRCHLVNIRSEEGGELEGDELEERVAEIEEQQRAQHYDACPQCQQLHLRLGGEG